MIRQLAKVVDPFVRTTTLGALITGVSREETVALLMKVYELSRWTAEAAYDFYLHELSKEPRIEV